MDQALRKFPGADQVFGGNRMFRSANVARYADMYVCVNTNRVVYKNVGLLAVQNNRQSDRANKMVAMCGDREELIVRESSIQRHCFHVSTTHYY